MTLKAVIFDMDGVLIDACAIHRECLKQALIDHQVGGDIDEAALEGLPTKEKLRMLGLSGDLAEAVAKRKQELTLEAASRYPRDTPRRSMLAGLRNSGYRIGVYTNSIRKTAMCFLDRAGLLTFVDVLISNQEVKAPKPDPEGYLLAMRIMDVEPGETLIVEDSPVGLRAAFDSGAVVIAVTFETALAKTHAVLKPLLKD